MDFLSLTQKLMELNGHANLFFLGIQNPGAKFGKNQRTTILKIS